ncbi:MAG: diphosphate--fructose-6-phosphate 1-phosphotransferase [Treponema sp.]|jgi:pyrophosphate--fructose-6-phosphate 1-phosphotransferase|nr:diphosphate--fructose-6-phosphate 1-phosphotransferase [Treponema sp.]
MDISALQQARYSYQPRFPRVLSQEPSTIALSQGLPTQSIEDQGALKALFKHTYGKALVQVQLRTGQAGENMNRTLRVGVILSGGQAPGGHNVIAGLYDGLKRGNPGSRLYGFLGGPSGLIENTYRELSDAVIDAYRNTGGFDMIGSGRTKVESPAQFASSLETAKQLRLDALLIIGGDDSNTNAAVLAEYFLDQGSPIQVIGCPKTIDGDLKNEHIQTSFGFDTAVKTYSELIGNIARDANSAKKYWHFIKLMGRSASHITLECALKTRPNVCFISEEVAEKKWSLGQIVDQICASVIKRAEHKEYFGVVLIPEGLVEFVPEMKQLILELNDTLARYEGELAALPGLTEHIAFLCTKLSPAAQGLLGSLPGNIARELLMDRDPHGNVQVSRIETEKLLMGMVEKRLARLKEQGLYTGKFSALGHFFGYEGRSAFPSNFDANYGYSLGLTAFVLIASGLTGYIACVKNLSAPPEEWVPAGLPLTMMMHLEQRHGSRKPVIKKALVDLASAPFKAFAAERDTWACTTSFLFPGGIQYFGPPELCDRPPRIVELEQQGKA